MTETMIAVVKNKPGQGAWLVERALPKLAPDQVLVKVRATSICGTDVHIYKWDDWAATRIGAAALPQIMGHEVAGDVVETGAHVRRIKVGDYVSAETHIYDPSDITAQVGQLHIGDHMKILGVDCDGAFAEYFAVPESVCWINDRSLPPELATVQEPLGNAVYTLLGEDHDIAGKSMVIVGDGPIALMAVAAARTCGVAKIFLVGMAGFNLEIGRRLGADHILNVTRDVQRVDYVKDHTYGAGADIVLEMAGNQAAIEDGFRMLRRGGRFSAFGITERSPVSLDYNAGIIFKGAQIHGINGRKMFDTWYRVRNLLVTGRLDIRPVITHMFTLRDFQPGFDALLAQPRECAKVVLFPDPAELAAARQRQQE